MSAPTLPIEGITRCGYCGQRLVMWAVDDWRCPRCAPDCPEHGDPDWHPIIDQWRRDFDEELDWLGEWRGRRG